jgi:hypothetical protein
VRAVSGGSGQENSKVTGGPSTGRPTLSAVEVNRLLQRQFLFLIPGGSAILAATYFYPPVDANPLIGVCLIVFSAPILLHIVLGVRHRLPSNFALLRSTYDFAAVLAGGD